MEKTVIICDYCHKQLEESLVVPYIKMPQGDLDNAGIWFGNLHTYLWFIDQTFCDFECFWNYLSQWYQREKLALENKEKK